MELNPELNRKCSLKVTVHEAKFLSDADAMGNQDPFVQFMYDGKYIMTKVIDGGGKHAVFNQTFELENIFQ